MGDYPPANYPPVVVFDKTWQKRLPDNPGERPCNGRLAHPAEPNGLKECPSLEDRET